jgi:hypothetical protein
MRVTPRTGTGSGSPQRALLSKASTNFAVFYDDGQRHRCPDPSKGHACHREGPVRNRRANVSRSYSRRRRSRWPPDACATPAYRRAAPGLAETRGLLLRSRSSPQRTSPEPQKSRRRIACVRACLPFCKTEAGRPIRSRAAHICACSIRVPEVQSLLSVTTTSTFKAQLYGCVTVITSWWFTFWYLLTLQRQRALRDRGKR